MTRVRMACAVATAALLIGLLPVPGRSSERAFERDEFSGSLQILNKLAASGAFSGGAGQITKSTCESSGDPKATIDLSCDGNTDPENETPIVVDPNDPNHLLAGSNDYHIFIKGASITARIPTGFFVSFDGGKNWTDGQIPMGSGGSGGNGDPTPAFDSKHGVALMGQLTAGCGQLGPYCGNISVSVSRSKDGGVTWSVPVTVAQGSGSLTPSADGVFNDKPWLTVDNDPTSPYYGRSYLAYTRYVLSGGFVVEAPIYLVTSNDGGRTWTKPREISGSNPTFCTFQLTTAGRCNLDEFSTPVVLPGGMVVVHFLNQQNERAWESAAEFEDQTMVVRSTDGGATWSNAIHIANLEDGAGTDFPLNADGRSTQTGFQFRTQTVQGMSVDPITGFLYAFWTDNRDGERDTGDTPVTDTNVFMTKSTDGGLTWSGALRVTSGPGDRWMAWGAAQDGVLKVMFMDASYFSTPGLYGITLGTSTNGGTTWQFKRVDAATSDANHSIWFHANVEGCETCSLFIGDYNGLAIDSLGRTHIAWADMSRTDSIPAIGREGAPEDAFYARR